MTSVASPRGSRGSALSDVFCWDELPDLLAAEELFAEALEGAATSPRSARDEEEEDEEEDDEWDDDEEEDDTMKQLLVGMLPAMLNRGGGGGGAPQLPDGTVDKMIEQAFESPEIIQKIAMRNPQGIAGAFMRAIKTNPALEKAVLDAVEKSSDDED